MRVFVSASGSRGPLTCGARCRAAAVAGVEPVVGRAVWLPALGAEVPVGQPVRPLVHGATSPPTADLPRRAAEVVAAVAEGCDPLVMRGVMPVGVWL